MFCVERLYPRERFEFNYQRTERKLEAVLDVLIQRGDIKFENRLFAVKYFGWKVVPDHPMDSDHSGVISRILKLAPNWNPIDSSYKLFGWHQFLIRAKSSEISSESREIYSSLLKQYGPDLKNRALYFPKQKKISNHMIRRGAKPERIWRGIGPVQARRIAHKILFLTIKSLATL